MTVPTGDDLVEARPDATPGRAVPRMTTLEVFQRVHEVRSLVPGPHAAARLGTHEDPRGDGGAPRPGARGSGACRRPPNPSWDSCPGEDRKLADWGQVVAYSGARRRVAAGVEEIGRTTEGRPFVMVTITSEANNARLEEIRRTTCASPTRAAWRDDEAERLVARARRSWRSSTRSTRPRWRDLDRDQDCLHLAAASDARGCARSSTTGRADGAVAQPGRHRARGRLVPAARWARRSRATPRRCSTTPTSATTTTATGTCSRSSESRLTVRALYQRWHPQIVHDVHQMGTRAARLFVPPYMDPWEPNVDPALTAAVGALGAHVAARLTAEGARASSGRALRRLEPRARVRAQPRRRADAVGGAAARMASPIEVTSEELERGIGYDPRRAPGNFPTPWPGGAWSLRDIVDTSSRAPRSPCSQHAARNREHWLRTVLAVNRRARRAASLSPSWSRARRGPAATAGSGRAATGGVEVLRATGAVHRRRPAFTAGPWSCDGAARTSAFAKMLLERQDYPDIRHFPGAPAKRPYDVTAHTLPLLLGVEVDAVGRRFERGAGAGQGGDASFPGRSGPRARGWRSATRRGELVALGRLLRAGVPVRWATAEFADGGRRFPAGTLLVPASARARVTGLARSWASRPRRGGAAAPPRAAGAARRALPVLDGVDRRGLDALRVRAADGRRLPDAARPRHPGRRAARALRRDRAARPGAGRDARRPRAGLDAGRVHGRPRRDGRAGAGAFVEAGGTLMALDSAAARLAVRERARGAGRARGRDAPPGDVAAGRRATSDFYCPGAMLRVARRRAQPARPRPLGRSAAIWFEDEPGLRRRDGHGAGRYREANPLLSGWLLGEREALGKAALVEVPLGRAGSCCSASGPSTARRAGRPTPPLLNAIYTSAARDARAEARRVPRHSSMAADLATTSIC